MDLASMCWGDFAIVGQAERLALWKAAPCLVALSASRFAGSGGMERGGHRGVVVMPRLRRHRGPISQAHWCLAAAHRKLAGEPPPQRYCPRWLLQQPMPVGNSRASSPPIQNYANRIKRICKCPTVRFLCMLTSYGIMVMKWNRVSQLRW